MKKNKAEKFVERTFDEMRASFPIGEAKDRTFDQVNIKFDGKKIPPEYINALNELVNKHFI